MRETKQSLPYTKATYQPSISNSKRANFPKAQGFSNRKKGLPLISTRQKMPSKQNNGLQHLAYRPNNRQEYFARERTILMTIQSQKNDKLHQYLKRQKNMRSHGLHQQRGRKLNTDTDGQVETAMHLFTEIPIASFEKNPQLPHKQHSILHNPNHPNTHRRSYSQSQESYSPLGSHLHSSSTMPLRIPRRQHSINHPKGNALQRQRILNLCKNLTSKLSRNSPFRNTADQQEFQQFHPKEATRGWEVPESVRNWWDVLASLVMLLLFLSQTFLLVFPELEDCTQMQVAMSLGTVIFAGEILLNVVAVRRLKGRKVRALGEIAWSYLRGQFTIDVSFLLLLFLDVITHSSQFTALLVVLSTLKVKSLLGKLHRIQRWLFKTEYYERYWSLLKIMFFNLAFAHTIAIILNVMVRAHPEQNWQVTRGISEARWQERYIWSYYWATTIMLTVGFGDITPATYHEAMWVVVIEIVSCIAFSYNISCLGTLIANIRAQGDLIKRNRKVFQNFAEKRNLPEAITERVLHYIDESGQVKARFSIVQQRELIAQLPQSYRTQVLAQSNKTLLKSLPFFNQILLRAICELSKKLQRNVYFPDETIRYARSDPHIYILEKGEVGFACRTPGSILDRIYADTVKTTQKQEPFLLNTQFLTQIQCKYDLRARDYSIVHKLSFDEFKSTLSNFQKDYQYYCFLRDRAKVVIDEYQTVPCMNCKQKHTRFSCPRLHFMPLKEHVLHRELYNRQVTKDQRTITFERPRWRRSHVLIQERLCERERVQLAQLRGDSYEELPILPTLKDCKAEGVLRELKTMSLDWREKEERYGEVFTSLKMMQLRDELKAKEESQEDEIWLLACDRIQDYTIFFPESNLKAIMIRQRQARKALLGLQTYS